MDVIQATYQSSPEFAKLAARRYMRRQFGQLILWSFVVLAGCGGALVMGHSDWYVVVPLCVAGGILLLTVLYYTGSDRAFASMPDPQVTIRVSAETIEFETSEHTSTLAWGRISKVWRFADVWLFFSYPGAPYVAVPAEILTEKARDIIERNVEQNGGEVE